eukprot:XP_001707774.1 Hypothetical protein GL50803_38557 [Giardia lamblia ATCC 50803]
MIFLIPPVFPLATAMVHMPTRVTGVEPKAFSPLVEANRGR